MRVFLLTHFSTLFNIFIIIVTIFVFPRWRTWSLWHIKFSKPKNSTQRMFKKTSVWLCSFVFSYLRLFLFFWSIHNCADFNDWRWKWAWIGSPGLVKSHPRLAFLTIEQMLFGRENDWRISLMHFWLTCLGNTNRIESKWDLNHSYFTMPAQ